MKQMEDAKKQEKILILIMANTLKDVDAKLQI